MKFRRRMDEYFLPGYEPLVDYFLKCQHGIQQVVSSLS